MIDKSELDDIFGIPQDGSHLDDGSADDGGVFSEELRNNSSSKSFDDQLISLNKDTECISNSHLDLTKVLSIKDYNKIDGGAVEEFSNTQNIKPIRKNVDDSVSGNINIDIQVPSQSIKPLGDVVHNEREPCKASVEHTSKNNKEQSLSTFVNLPWNVNTDSSEFYSFYKMKKDSLTEWLLPGGEINFNKTLTELVNAKVDLSTIEFGDIHAMFDALKNIQKWKDRIMEISLRVNAQYYSWKRAVDLFRGSLARMHYEKPAEKQDGVVMEHMGDMIMYYSQLESLHANIDAVTGNLDNAFDCISRQITISLPQTQRDSFVVEKKVNKNISEGQVLSGNFDEILMSMDTLPKNNITYKQKDIVTNTSGKKIGTVNWTDI